MAPPIRGVDQAELVRQPRPIESNSTFPARSSGPTPDAPIASSTTPQPNALLSPRTTGSGHSRKRSTSSTSKTVDPLISRLPQLPFLGIPFQGETDTLGSGSSDEEDVYEQPANFEENTNGEHSKPETLDKVNAPTRFPPLPPISPEHAVEESEEEFELGEIDLVAAIERELFEQEALRRDESRDKRRSEGEDTSKEALGRSPIVSKLPKPESAPTRILYDAPTGDDDSDLYGVSDEEEDDSPARHEKSDPNGAASGAKDLEPMMSRGDATTLKRSSESINYAAATIPTVFLEATHPKHHSVRSGEKASNDLKSGLGLSWPDRSRNSSTSSESDGLQRLREAVMTSRRENRRLAEKLASSGIDSSTENNSEPQSFAPKLDLPYISAQKTSFEIDFREHTEHTGPEIAQNARSAFSTKDAMPSEQAVALQIPTRAPPPIPPRRPLSKAQKESSPPSIPPEANDHQPQPARSKQAPAVLPPLSRYHRKTLSAASASKPLPLAPEGYSPATTASYRRPPPPPLRSAPLPPTASMQISRSTGPSPSQTPDPSSGLIPGSPLQGISAPTSSLPEVARLASPGMDSLQLAKLAQTSPLPEVAGLGFSGMDSPQVANSDDASTISISVTGSRDSFSGWHDAESVGSRTANPTLSTSPTHDSNDGIDTAAEASSSQQQKKSILKSLQKSIPKSEGHSKLLKGRIPRPRLTKSFLGSENSTKQKIFHEAAGAGNNTLLLEYLKEKTKLVNSFEKLDRDQVPKTALTRAAEGNHVSCMECLVVNGAEYGTADKEGKIALHYAVEAGSLAAVRFFTERFHSPPVPQGHTVPRGPLEIADNSGFRALHIAAGKGKIDVLEALLDGGAVVDSCDNFGRTPLFPALLGYHLDAFKLLLERGADMNHSDHEKKNVLMWAAEANAQKAVELLLERGVDRHEKDAEGNQAVHLAAAKGHVTVLEMLYLKIEDLEGKNFAGERPLHLAAGAGKIRAARALMRIGCSTLCFTTGNRKPSAKTKSFKDLAATPLHYACAAGADNVVEDIVFHSADNAMQLVNANQEDGTSPLMLACQANCFAATLLLLEHGANPNAKTKTDQLTALHYAIKHNDVESTQLLARNGADIMAVTKKGLTPHNFGNTNNSYRVNDAAAWLVKHQRSTLQTSNNDRQQAAQPPGPPYYGAPAAQAVTMVPAPARRRPNINITGMVPLPAPGPAPGQPNIHITGMVPAPASGPAPGRPNIQITPYPGPQGYVRQPAGSYVHQPYGNYRSLPIGYYRSSTRTDEGVEPPPAYTPEGP